MVKLYAIIRIRGRLDTPPDVKYTLRLLRLHKKFHMVLYPADQPGLPGMLQKVKDWVTWGEINYDTLVELLRKRGRTLGNKPLTDEYVESRFKAIGIYGGIPGLAKALLDGKARLHKLDGVKPVFRLHPPRGGFKRSTKRPYNDGGELGYRGEAINDLIRRML